MPGEADQLTLVALRTAESWSSSAARVSLMKGWSSWFVHGKDGRETLRGDGSGWAANQQNVTARSVQAVNLAI